MKQTKTDALLEKIADLPKIKFMKFLAEWHGENYLWDSFNDSISAIGADEGEKVVIEMIIDTLKSCNITL
jgi:hypothetical protein